MSATARITVNLALITASLGLATLVGEVVSRKFIQLPLVRLEPEVRYDAHASRRFTLRPQQEAFTYGAEVSIDEDGFRVNGRSDSQSNLSTRDDRALVVALGDSFTFGLGVD